MNKKIIVFGVRSDYTETAYSNLCKRKDFFYYRSLLFRKYINYCERHKLIVINFFLKIMFFLFLFRFDKKDKIIFIYHGVDNVKLIQYGFLDYCRKKRPNIYHFGVFWDVFDFENKIDAQFIKTKFDDVFIIDLNMAKKYGISYYPLFYTKKYTNSTIENKKVFFCGEDGGRLNILKQIALFLRQNGIDYSFYCSNSKAEFTDEFSIHYIKRMNHDDYINELQRCSIILDLTKPGATCCSLRFCEAVLYDKKLLSDNYNITFNRAYDGNYMRYFSSVDKIDLDFLNSNKQIHYSNKKYVLPDGLIEHIFEKMSL